MSQLVHRRAGLAEPVDVDDRGQVVEPVEAGLLEGLPHRALGHLGVAAEAPDAIREPVQALAGEPDADADRQALAEGAGGHVDPGRTGRGMALDPAAEPAEGEHLVVADRAGRLEHRVQQRGGVALAEDQVVVARVIGVAEVVVQVLRHQHGHEVGRGHRRGRVAAPRARSRNGSSRPAAAARARATRPAGRSCLFAPQVVCPRLSVRPQ